MNIGKFTEQELLFKRNNYARNLEQIKKQMFDYIDKLGEQIAFGNNIDDLCKHVKAKFNHEIPKISKKNIQVDSEEVDIDVTHNTRYAARKTQGKIYARGIEFTFVVPFTGNRNLFFYEPSVSSLNPPRGIVKREELHLIEEVLQDEKISGEEINQRIDMRLNDVESFLECQRQDVNSTLTRQIKSRIERRQKKILKDNDLIANIKFPLRKRENACQTYKVPLKKKLSSTTLKKLGQQTPVPELLSDDYENILEIMSRMVQVMECSPKAFRNLDEEALRFHFLVQLNGQYKGTATGETFNYNGKTDIIIKENGKNIFIGECKFWKGPKSLTNVINQILQYISWRDTKAALILFNQNKRFTKVLKEIPNTVENHEHFVNKLSQEDQTRFRYAFKHPDDPEKRLLLSILAFDVPKE